MLNYDSDWLKCNLSENFIFTEIVKLPNSLLFLPAQICCTDKIKLISTHQNDSMQQQRNDLMALLLPKKLLETPTSCLKYNISKAAESKLKKSTPILCNTIRLTLNTLIDFSLVLV